MIYKKEVEDFVEEALQYGYIDYNNFGAVSIFYKNYVIWLYFDDKSIVVAPVGCYLSFSCAVGVSKSLRNKLKSMFKTWEAV